MKFKTKEQKIITIKSDEIDRDIALQKKIKAEYERDPDYLQRKMWEKMMDLDVEEALSEVEEKQDVSNSRNN